MQYLLANALAHVVEALTDVGRIIVAFIRVLARYRQYLLVCDFERLDASLEFDVVMGEFGLLAGIACPLIMVA